MIGTPGRYVRNGKRHKEQKPSKNTAVVCAWVSGRGSRDVSSLRDRLASEWDGSEPVGIYWAVSKAPSKGDFVSPGAYRAKADSESTEWDELQQGWYDCPKR
jgi:hypothetical protein